MRKILKISKILLISLIILGMVFIPVTSKAAFNFWPFLNKDNANSMLNKKYGDANNYKNFLSDLNRYIQSIDKNKSVSDTKIDIIDKMTELQNKYKDTSIISSSSTEILNKIISSNAKDSSSLITSIVETLKSLSKNSSNSALKSLKPNEVVEISATTAGRLSGDKYKVSLSGNIYYANADSEGKPTSKKWVVLVHGFMMNGQAMADSLGQMYLDQGFNVFAPDLRGFGNSKGSVAMGYLESLDVWDWLTYLNDKYPNNCDEIFVHGVSLGGATTVFLSGLTVGNKTIKDQNVIGLVEDCGYTSMTGIVKDMLNSYSDNKLVAKILGIFNKTDLSDVVGEATIKKLIIEKVDVGLTPEKYDELQSSVNSLKKSSTPLLIIHGTEDSTVPVTNSDEIYATANANANIPYVQRFKAEGEQHAFIILGNKENVYEGHVDNFITQAEKIKNGTKVNKHSDYVEKTEQKTSMIGGLVKALKLIKNMFGV